MQRVLCDIINCIAMYVHPGFVPLAFYDTDYGFPNTHWMNHVQFVFVILGRRHTCTCGLTCDHTPFTPRECH